MDLRFQIFIMRREKRQENNFQRILSGNGKAFLGSYLIKNVLGGKKVGFIRIEFNLQKT